MKRLLVLLGALLCSVAPAAASRAQVEPASHGTQSLSGSGNDVVDLGAFSGPHLLDLRHTGSSNFIVWALDEQFEKSDLLVNEIGGYRGRVLVNGPFSGEPARRLEVTADGAWSVTLRPISSAAWWTGEISGSGDTVVVYGGRATLLDYRHVGNSNFIVWTHGDDDLFDSDLLVNEIGSTEGTVGLAAGISTVTIEADGAWTLNARASAVAVSRPDAPAAVAITGTGTTIGVWVAAPASTGGAAVTQYTATCSSSNGGTLRVGAKATNPVVVADLTAGATYTCTGRAYNRAGPSYPSPASAPYTTPGG